MPFRMPCSHLRSRLGTSPKETSVAIIKHVPLLPKGSPGLKKVPAWQESSDSGPGGRFSKGKNAPPLSRGLLCQPSNSSSACAPRSYSWHVSQTSRDYLLQVI